MNGGEREREREIMSSSRRLGEREREGKSENRCRTRGEKTLHFSRFSEGSLKKKTDYREVRFCAGSQNFDDLLSGEMGIL